MTAPVRISAAEAAALLAKPRKGRYPRAAKADRTMDGVVFDSAAEMRWFAELQLAERAGLIRNLERQVALPVSINGAPYCVYTADARWFDEHGECVVAEFKSVATQRDTAYRLRKRAAEIYYGIKIIEVVR